MFKMYANLSLILVYSVQMLGEGVMAQQSKLPVVGRYCAARKERKYSIAELSSQ